MGQGLPHGRTLVAARREHPQSLVRLRQVFTVGGVAVMIDNFAIPAATIRGLFDYEYRSDRLILRPRVPGSITQYTQKEPVRFGEKALYLSCRNGGPKVKSVTVNGKASEGRIAGRGGSGVRRTARRRRRSRSSPRAAGRRKLRPRPMRPFLPSSPKRTRSARPRRVAGILEEAVCRSFRDEQAPGRRTRCGLRTGVRFRGDELLRGLSRARDDGSRSGLLPPHQPETQNGLE